MCQDLVPNTQRSWTWSILWPRRKRLSTLDKARGNEYPGACFFLVEVLAEFTNIPQIQKSLEQFHPTTNYTSYSHSHPLGRLNKPQIEEVQTETFNSLKSDHMLEIQRRIQGSTFYAHCKLLSDTFMPENILLISSNLWLIKKFSVQLRLDPNSIFTKRGIFKMSEGDCCPLCKSTDYSWFHLVANCENIYTTILPPPDIQPLANPLDFYKITLRNLNEPTAWYLYKIMMKIVNLKFRLANLENINSPNV